MEPGIEKQNWEHQNHRKQEQHWKRNQTPPKEEQPPEAINLSQNEPMKNQIRENPIDLETKEGNSQMKCEKQPKENQPKGEPGRNETSPTGLESKTGNENCGGDILRNRGRSSQWQDRKRSIFNDKTERGAFSTAENWRTLAIDKSHRHIPHIPPPLLSAACELGSVHKISCRRRRSDNSTKARQLSRQRVGCNSPDSDSPDPAAICNQFACSP
jgi:hypothetical protein